MRAKDLRNSILQMAVQGKLVPQDPSDEPAFVLLERIRAERAQLIKEKKIKAPKGGESVIYRASDGSHYEKRGKGEPVCIDDEIPFGIPESWEWVRLESLLTSGPTNGFSPKPVDYETAVKRLSLGATTSGSFDGSQFKYVDIPVAKAERYWLSPGDLLIQRSNTRDYVGTSCVYDGAGETFIYPDLIMKMTLVNMVMVQYVDIALKSPYARAYYSESASGSAGNMPKINQSIVCSTFIPLPPLEEQRRIIESIEELTPLIDSYDALESARESLDASLLDRLHKSILQLAVQGRLVEQDPNDEPASVLLDRIRAERVALVKTGRLKAPKGGESVIYRASDGGYYEKRGKGVPEPIDVPFDIPDTWEWARLKTLGEIVGGGTPKTHDASLWASPVGGIPWITPADMKNAHGRRVSHGERYLSEKGLSGSSAQLMPAGTVVMSSRAPIGYLAITDRPIATNQGFKSVVPTLVDTNAWIMLALDALMDDIKRRASGTTFKEISGFEFGETLIPIPPLPEQRRIIERSERSVAAIG